MAKNSKASTSDQQEFGSLVQIIALRSRILWRHFITAMPSLLGLSE